MKSTGIVRRIDELGRIVIPKEMRKSLRIHEGDNLEFYIEGDNIILSKQSMLDKIEDLAQNFTDVIHGLLKQNVMITDKDMIIAVSGSLKKQFLNKSLSSELEHAIVRRSEIVEAYKKELVLAQGESVTCTYIIQPIVVHGDVLGLVLFISEEKVGDLEEKVVQIASQFLSKYLEG